LQINFISDRPSLMTHLKKTAPLSNMSATTTAHHESPFNSHNPREMHVQASGKRIASSIEGKSSQNNSEC